MKRYRSDGTLEEVPEPGAITIAGKAPWMPAETKGDVSGHAFHGNRYTGGVGGDAKPPSIASRETGINRLAALVRTYAPEQVEPLGHTPTVGESVVAFSRGSLRAAEIVAVGKTNCEVRYTTAGAITEAQKIYQNYAARTPQATEAAVRKQEASNFAFYSTEASRETMQFADHSKEEEIQRRLAEGQRIVAIGREAYIQGKVDKALAEQAAAKAQPIEDFIHFTSKTVKISDLYRPKAG